MRRQHVEHLGGKLAGGTHAGKALGSVKLDRAARDFGVFRRLDNGVTGHKSAYSSAISNMRAAHRPGRRQDTVNDRTWTAALVIIGDQIMSGRTQDAKIPNQKT